VEMPEVLALLIEPTGMAVAVLGSGSSDAALLVEILMHWM